MNSRDFCYWLQGYFEIADAYDGNYKVSGLTGTQVDMIRRHLGMVFIHEIDPSFPAEQQEALDAAHTGEQTEIVGNLSGVAKPVRPDKKMRC